MIGPLETKVVLIDLLVKNVQFGNPNVQGSTKYGDYEKLEYEIYLFARSLADYDYTYQNFKIATEERETEEYIELGVPKEGEKELSEAKKERLASIAVMKENKKKLESKAEMDKYKSYLYSVSRMADSFKSGFIREQGETKRQNLAENNSFSK